MTDATPREAGSYHVKFKGKWTVAEMWHGCESGLEVWALPGKLGRIDVDYFDEIGHRIRPPLKCSAAEVEARAFFEAHLDQLDPVVQRHVRALLREGR